MDSSIASVSNIYNACIVIQQSLNMRLKVKALSSVLPISISSIRNYVAFYLFGNEYVFKIDGLTFSRKRAVVLLKLLKTVL